MPSEDKTFMLYDNWKKNMWLEREGNKQMHSVSMSLKKITKGVCDFFSAASFVAN